MKKIMVYFMIFVFSIINVPYVFALSSESKSIVTLSNCVDSTSARFMQNNNEIKVKFIGIDTANALSSSINEEISVETVNNFVCDKLKNAKKIELELEKEMEEKDKYDRYNAWVFIDDVLLQDILVKEGYAKTYYLYENYKYYDILKQDENSAKDAKTGIWNVKEEEKIEVIDESEKEESLFDMLLNFVNKVFEKILKFVDDLIKNVFN